MSKEKKRRPWNASVAQVYSISSIDNAGKINLNIATYVTPVTMDPKRYIVAVYKNTQTHINIWKRKKVFLLQALSLEQIDLVKPFGKKSGKRINKESWIHKKKIEGTPYEGLFYMKKNFFTLVCMPEQYIELDDHDLVICRISQILQQNNTVGLTTHDLQKAGIIG